jgi:hypothetical protein
MTVMTNHTVNARPPIETRIEKITASTKLTPNAFSPLENLGRRGLLMMMSYPSSDRGPHPEVRPHRPTVRPS